ncbi:hypothetical protein GGI15_001554 [Coemansia interrupta]|uniref:Uncharacterized protein n=1 Tax=Coemansia interrupta TaxID=1126814 RepID=A0A9W8HQZ1_9FUNG|nr:hypothetical protein GGI15_001554 [Coemansia interrupta]
MFTLTLETTFRPRYTDTGSDTYSPIPLTPDLGQIVNSIAAQPSVSEAMRRVQYDDNTRDEL